MTINIEERLYKIENRVYFGTTELTVHSQRGRLFVKHKGKQHNLRNIPAMPKDEGQDSVFDYVFAGGFQTYPCPAIDYLILRHRLKHRISPQQYQIAFLKGKQIRRSGTPPGKNK